MKVAITESVVPRFYVDCFVDLKRSQCLGTVVKVPPSLEEVCKSGAGVSKSHNFCKLASSRTYPPNRLHFVHELARWPG